MKTKALRRPATPIVLAGALLAAFLVLVSPLSASAHDALVSSSPAADSSVETVPSDLTLTFNAKLIDGEGATEVVVTAPDGTNVAEGAPTVEGAVVTQPLRGSGPAGAYGVVWKVVSSDGHATSGEFSFTVTTGDEAAATTEPSATPSPAPTATQTATPDDTTTPTPEPTDSADGSVWIWILAIIGALVVIALVVWLATRGRRGTPPAGSDAPSER